MSALARLRRPLKSWNDSYCHIGEVMIRTPDQRLRVFVSSTLGELAEERAAVRRAVERLRLSPVMFELGARPHPPRDLYRAYLEQSHVFVGVYWQRYGWIAPGESISGLEDEYRLAGRLPQLVYIKEPAPEREAALTRLLHEVKSRDSTSYRRFHTGDELEELVSGDLAVLLSERFESTHAAAVPSPRRAPLPAVLTRTIGREAEVAQILGLLAGDARLVTITGPGGVGKTRVAMEVAHARASRPGEVVHYIPLAAVTSANLVMASVADQLDVRGVTGRSPVESLIDHFGTSRVLLVLDNLEQVITVAPEISGLVEQAPGVQVIVTSRQPLRLRGEHQVAIGRLGTPGDEVEVDDIARSSAVQLFVDRARAFGGRFELTAGNAAAVAELCRRLEGLPLALELVAAHLRIVSPQMLLERLGTVLDLESAVTGLPERQQTLRATLDWSHALLSADEGSLFAQLGVFAGGATLDAIESVCVVTGGDILDIFAGVLDKSLVVAGDIATGGEPRFEMLEPVAEYAREQLVNSADADATRRRHLDYYSRLGREAQPYLCGPQQREWAARFDAERPNLRVAMVTAFDAGSFGTILRLVWDTLVYFYIRDGIVEPRQWVLQLAVDRDAFDDTQQALLDVAMVIVGAPPDDRDVIGLLTNAVTVLDGDGLDLEAAVSQHHLGIQRWRTGDPGAAISALEASSQRYAAIDHDWGVATVEMTLGAVLAAVGDLESAIQHYRRSLEHSRRIGNRPEMAQALQGLALVDALRGGHDEAGSALDEAIGIVLTDRSVTLASYCLEALAALAILRDDPRTAVQLISAARSTRRRLSIPEWTAAADAAGPALARAHRALSEADFADAWSAGAGCDVFSLLASSTLDRSKGTA